MNLENIKQGIIVCEDSIKKEILSNTNIFHHYKFFTLEKFIENLTYKINKDAILFVSRKFNTTLSIAKKYCSYLKYDRKFYKGEAKLDKLIEIRDDLLNEGLLIQDKSFIESLKNENITFLYYVNDSELRFAFDILKENNLEYEYIQPELSERVYNRDIYSFKDITSESRFVFNEIKSLLDHNVDIERIKIVNYSEAYDFDFARLSSYFKIPVHFAAKKNILSTRIAHYLLDNLNNYESFKVLLDDIKDKFPNSPYLKNIANIINSYHLEGKYKPSEVKDVFVYELSNTKFNEDIYERSIEICDINTASFKETDYVFFLGFSLNQAPFIVKDVEYLSDDILSKMGLDTSTIINKHLKDVLFNNINNIRHITITRSNSSYNETYYPSTLIKEHNYYQPNDQTIKYGHNEKEDQLYFSSILDAYNKFNDTSNKDLNNVYDINYLGYDNAFKGGENVKDAVPEVVKLSYSSIDKYFKCAFSYYLASVLYVNEFEDSFNTMIGTYAHHILEHSYDDDFDFEKIHEEAIKKGFKDKELTAKEQFFIDIMKKQIEELITFNKEKESISELDKRVTETEANVVLEDGKLIITGKIDKILYKHENEYDLVCIIDYKTGTSAMTPNKNNINNGLNIQLPIYTYLVKHGDLNNGQVKIKAPIYVGVFLQRLDPSIIKDKFILDGLFNDNVVTVEKLDPELEEVDRDKRYIKLAKVTKAGVFGGKGVKERYFSNKDMNKIIEDIQKLLKEAYDKIRLGEFIINPKMLNNHDKSCEYCNFKNVCFHKKSNYVYLVDSTASTDSEKKDGEENA